MKKYFKVIVLLTHLGIFCFSAIAQTNTPAAIPDVFPPSPQAAALGKFGEIPVSHYTGVPNISVPLFNLKSRSLPISISLSYHAGGAKIDDQSGTVGLGWNLNAGGMISRTVRGLPDEKSTGGFLDTTYSFAEIENNPVIAALAADGQIDTQPDLFYFNFNGYSGKMFYDRSGNIHIHPKRKFQVSKNNAGWKIITEDGTEYLFEIREEQEAQTICTRGSGIPFQNPVPQYVSGWHLSKITSADKQDIVTLEYTAPVIVEYPVTASASRYYKTGGNDPAATSYNLLCSNTLEFHTRYLKKINFLNGYVDFQYGNRTDLSNALALKRVGIYNLSHQQINEYVFNQGYFVYQSDFKKLSLLNLKEQKSNFNPASPLDSGTVSAEKPPYIFDYFTNPNSPTDAKKAQDFWGFYNGRENPDLLPTWVIPNGSTPTIIPGADRYPYLESARSYTLKKIQYPTGGFTGFDYELNEVVNENIEYSSKNTPVSYQVTDLNRTEKIFTINSYGSSFGGLTAKVTLTTPQCTGSPVGSVPCSTGNEPACNQNVVGCPVTIKIQKCNLFNSGGGNPNIPLPNGCLNWIDTVVYNGWYSIFSSQVFLKDGLYKISAVAPTPSSAFSGRVTYSEKDVTFLPNNSLSPGKKVGGLRIKTIAHYSSDSDGSPIIKTYKYADSEGIPSGRLTSVPIFTNTATFSRTSGVGGQCTQLTTSYFVLNAFSNASMGTTQGSYTGYAQVSEEMTGNGKTVHQFTSVQDSGFEDINNPSFPFGPSTSKDYKRGLPVNQQSFTAQNDGVHVIQKQYKYNTNNYFQERGIKVGHKISGDLCLNRTMNDFAISSFNEIADWFYENQTKDSVIYSNGALTQRTEMIYDENFYQIKKQQTVRSNATTESMEFKYPFDFALSGNVYEGMVNNNILMPVIEKIMKVDTQTQSIERTNYLKYHSQFFKPASVQTAQQGGPMVTKLTFSTYDTNTDLLSYTEQNGMITTLTYWNISGKNSLLKSKTTGNQTTQYDYIPLVGLSAQTDPNGRTTTYQYDPFNRLTKIFDHQNRLLKEFCYQFNGLPVNCAIGSFSGTVANNTNVGLLEDLAACIPIILRSTSVPASQSEKDFACTQITIQAGFTIGPGAEYDGSIKQP